MEPFQLNTLNHFQVPLEQKALTEINSVLFSQKYCNQSSVKDLRAAVLCSLKLSTPCEGARLSDSKPVKAKISFIRLDIQVEETGEIFSQIKNQTFAFKVYFC